MMNRSPDRHTFQLKSYLKRCEDDGVPPREDYINLYLNEAQDAQEHESREEWKQNNLEYDLRSTQWICDKAKAREEYAQNIYAALCNNSFIKNEVWPLLAGETWFCSWRYAGGIVADMRESGDYIDWYCSGIKGALNEDDFGDMTPEDIERYQWMQKNFVGEGHVTDEVRADLLKLGWVVAETRNNI